MEQRINLNEKGKQAMVALYGLGRYVAKSTIKQSLLDFCTPAK